MGRLRESGCGVGKRMNRMFQRRYLEGRHSVLKKRIKRALRAIGLVKPHQSSAGAKQAPPSQAMARSIVTELYQLVLKRDPNGQEQELYVRQLTSGKLSTVQVVRVLLESGEFGTAFSQHANVAATLSAVVLGHLARISDEAAVRAYAAGLMGAMPVANFISEICGSPEFHAAWGIGQGSPSATPIPKAAWSPGAASTVPSEIGEMVEGLIAARMIGEGAVLGLPPINAFDRPPVSAGQMVSLIRTLDMLAERPAR